MKIEDIVSAAFSLTKKDSYVEQTNWQYRKSTSGLRGWSEPMRSKARVLTLHGVHPSSEEGRRGG
jgi:hypothetical protein